MRITKVSIPKDETARIGLKAIEMSRLGQVVLIAGQNGAGKTRLINRIIEQCHTINQDGFNHPKYEPESLKTMAFSTDNRIHPVQFFPNKVDLVSYTSKTFDVINMEYRSLSEGGVTENINETCLSTIKQITLNYLMNTNGKVPIDEKNLKKCLNEFSLLENNIKVLLGTKILDNSTEPTLFGKPIDNAGLSAGQRILLQLALLLSVSGASLDDSIIFIDEPENHLHPRIVLEILDQIVNKIPNGQIWIATHSINILSHFDSENIWFMEKGRIAYAGKTPELVLGGLLGEEEERDKLKDFLMLPQNLGLQRFTYECLFPPAVVDTPKTDKQLEQIQIVISDRIRQGKIKILDYGAGKGRLLNSFIESPNKDYIDYLAYDEFDCDRSSCENKLVSLYGSSEKRYFNSLTGLSRACDKNTVDIVMMCNVLHEISPDKWEEEFKGTHSFMHLLKDEGYLVIIEDQLLAFGENAHNYGYLVLDECHLKKLFNIPADEYVVDDYDGSGRLKAHIIAKKYLSNINDKTIKDAINSLKATSKEEIERIKKENKNYKTGRLYSFWIMQYFNTLKALKEF